MIEEYALKYDAKVKTDSRHDKTMLLVKEAICRLINEFVKKEGKLLEIGAEKGFQTIAYSSKITNAKRPVIYDWKDQRLERVKRETDFFLVDIEHETFPDADATYDVIVCNQVLEHIKNIFLPLTEMHRVLKTGGILILSVPNICALHNCFLMFFGRQPTTMNIPGSHIRGFAVWSMSKFLTHNNHFRIQAFKGFGLHPLTSKELPVILRTYCHTPIWVLKKQASNKSTWLDDRKNTFTTTNF